MWGWQVVRRAAEPAEPLANRRSLCLAPPLSRNAFPCGWLLLVIVEHQPLRCLHTVSHTLSRHSP